jgi:hypothetical protein
MTNSFSRALRIEVAVLLILAQHSGASAWMKAADLDGIVAEVWKAVEIEPASKASDAEFLRRVALDLTGQPPSLADTIEFLESDNPDKRTKWIDKLLSSHEYASHRASIWMDLIDEGRVDKMKLPLESFQSFFEEAFAEDKPFDQTVRELIAAEGSSSENGGTYLIASHQAKQENLVGTTTRLFMGTRLQCAQCHDDKFAKWTQDDFWGMAAFYARTQVRPDEKMGNRPISVKVTDRQRGETVIPEGGTPVNLRTLPKEERREAQREMMMEQRENPVSPSFMGQPVSLKPRQNRREELAKLVTSHNNPLFARTMVNRVWSEMFGRGLIEPVDDLYGKDAVEFEPLLQKLAQEFIRSGHSMKHLYRLIATSQTYGRTSQGEDASVEKRHYFAQARLRPLSPRVLFDSLLAATGVESAVGKGQTDKRLENQKRRYFQRFELVFGNDEGNRATSFEGTIPQALMLMNDPLIARGLEPNKGTTLNQIGDRTSDPRERIRLLYLAALCREPNAAELNEALEYVKESLTTEDSILLADASPNSRGRPKGRGGNRGLREAAPYQDLFWALLNTTEFMYHH